MLAIWPLVPLPFLNPAWTCGSSQFTYCWSLVWHKSCWRRLPLAPFSCWADNPQTGEQLYQRSSHTVVKVLGPTTDFPTWGSGKKTENPREFDFEDQCDLITEIAQDWGNRLLEGTNKTLCTPGPRRKEQWPHQRLSQTCLWVSRSLWQRRGLTVACCKVGALTTAVLGAVLCWHKSFWRK